MLFTCPSRYSSTIGHTGVFSLGGWSPQLHARFLVPGVTQELHYDSDLAFAYRALTVSGAPFQGTSADSLASRPWVLQPRAHKEPGLGSGPFRSPLLRTSRLISLPPGTEMFQFPGFALASKASDGHRDPPGFPIRPSRDHRVCAAPPGLSQLTTAFIASVCPGIPHMPSFA